MRFSTKRKPNFNGSPSVPLHLVVTRQSIYSVELRHIRQSSSATHNQTNHTASYIRRSHSAQPTNGVFPFARFGKGVTSPKYTGVTVLWVTRIFSGLLLDPLVVRTLNMGLLHRILLKSLSEYPRAFSCVTNFPRTSS